ncbi:MAG: calcium-binding protein [Chloroflexota bacterium]
MKQIPKDKAREKRIYDMTADANDNEEIMLGWSAYLEDSIVFPFEAECIEQRRISPLRKGEKVTALELVFEDEDIGNEFFVLIEWGGRKLGIPLTQLKALKADKETRQAIEDWQYWKARGYDF